MYPSFQVPGVDGRDFFRNAGRSTHRGLEAGLRFAARDVSATLAYTFTDFRFGDDDNADTDFEDNRVPGVPPHHLFVTAAFDVDRVRLATDVEHTSGYFANDANTARNDAATIVSVRATARFNIGNLLASPFIALNNVTDQRYNSSVVVNAFGARFYEPAPGRNLHIGFTIGAGAWGR
jgi:iron complex outermembrane receptor protein